MNEFYSICHIDKFGNFKDIGVFFKSYNNALKYKERDERAFVMKAHFED